MSLKPHIQSVPLKTALEWSGAGQYLFEEKIDGRYTELSFAGCLLIGETYAGQFWPFDVVTLSGADVRQWPLQDRRRALDHICAEHGEMWPRPRVGCGGEFLEAILADGGEGIVAKEFGQPFGVGWFKAKRCRVYFCQVTSMSGSRQSVGLGILPELPFQDVKNWTVSRREKLTDAGNMRLSDDKYNSVRVGSILKIEAFGQHPSGRLREARLDKDAPGSWLVKF